MLSTKNNSVYKKMPFATGVLALLCHHGACAQQDSGREEAIEEVMVTGTLIKNSNLNSSAPVNTIDSAYIELSGETILSDLLQEMPALVGSETGNLSGDATLIPDDGTASLNLRNLGASRTLVLVNGRRHVASRAGTAVVDINTIPNSLVERVDILTGGASAIYGADGVSGVVNFILKDDYEGLETRFRTNVPDEAGGVNYLASLTAGSSFAGGRGNIAVNVGYFRQNSVSNRKRGISSGMPESLNLNPADGIGGVDDPNIPDRIFVAQQGIPFTAIEGVVFSGPFDFSFIPGYLGTGEVFETGIVTADGNTIGGDGLKDLNPVRASLLAEQDRYNVNLLSHYDISDSARAYLEFKYVRSELTRETGGAKSIDDFLPIAFDNAFLPAAIPREAVFDDADGNPIPLLFLGRDNFDIGSNDILDERDMFRIVTGLKGDINANITFDIAYVFGRVGTRVTDPSTRLEDRFFAALDAVRDPDTGDIVCRSNLQPTRRPVSIHDFNPSADILAETRLINSNGGFPVYSAFSAYDIRRFGDPTAPATTFTPGANSGCSPLNLFGFGQSSTEAQAFVAVPTTDKSRLTQHVLTASVSGDSSDVFQLPGGPLSFALGLEYRQEESALTPDGLKRRGATFDPAPSATKGDFSVTELFAEVRVPLIYDRPLFREVAAGAALRYSDYSTVGSTFTWQANASWKLSDAIALRGSFARAIRAPNINELFQPAAATFFEPDDPCLPAFRDQGSASRIANCRAELAAIGLSLEDYTMPPTGPFQGTTEGNEDLAEETSDSFTLGTIMTPGFLPDFSLAVDYWEIEIEDGILQPDIQDIVNQCYDAASIDNQFCALISRSPTTGNIQNGRQTTVNIASFLSSGIDLEANYRFSLAEMFGARSELGDIGLRLVGSRLNTLDLVTTAGGRVDDEVGEATTLLGGDAPQHIVNFDVTYRLDRLGFNYQYRRQSSVLLVEKTDLAAKPDLQSPTKTRAFRSHDISMSYQLGNGVKLFAGVNNLAKPSREIGTLRRDRIFFLGVDFRL